MTNTRKSIENGDIFDEYLGNFLNYHPVSLAIAVRNKLALTGMTQKELADRSGMSQAHINKIVKVKLKSIPESTARALKNALDLPEELDAQKPISYIRTMEKMEQALASGEVNERAWDAFESILDIVLTSTVHSYPSIAYDATQTPEYAAGVKISGYTWYMRALQNHVINAGFNQHEHWNRFAVTRSTQKYINNKTEKDNETYAVGVTPLQDDMFKAVRAVSNPRTGGAYDSYEIKSLSEQNGFSRDEIRYWLYYAKELSDKREVHVMIQHHEPYTSSDVERFTRAVDEFIIQSEGEQRQNWRR